MARAFLLLRDSLIDVMQDPPGSSGAPGGAGGAGAGAASDAGPKPLPHLPVPELEESAALFAKTIAPLLSHSERKELDEQLEELLAEGGNGRKLQALLKSRAASTDKYGGVFRAQSACVA